ncbi:hypothetical protein TBLA_0F01480 [Henningerozyma blattae CBS 6284]|uniref:Cyclin-like domain-containing protein n=1 Tax=Henningerozyma blattae (strain ATCC 34711 / CBS 6284 / DSM 70876 / NBRC 10599 / NRRL Y-10934 / UCD 77-7) TaxID=1071380 RepID=I2H5N9_HENB6|nr:hypothetical protein TBLA_0F01480 [Tetrapisispora blattae CBS 6284]CCH61691.1 hypothetical protein TBLA_0F01480 [Tetrapisispora blattae CBS 6284]
MPTMSFKSNQSDTTTSSTDKLPAYKRISDDDLYRHSTQYRLWSFTPEQLANKRIQTNEEATRKINDNLLAFIKNHSNDYTPEEITLIREKAIPVTMEEEIKLINFYTKKVQVIAQHLNLPTEIVATSISFFRRFFLENSVMEIDPKTTVHTTIFLACKSENYFIGVDSFAKKAKSSREAILKYEFQLLESLKFSLLNHHPYRALHGFFLDIQSVLRDKVDVKYMGQIYDRCKKRITDALLTDAVYFYTPPQITLAMLLLEDETLIIKYLETKFPSQQLDSNSENSNQNKDNSNEPNSTITGSNNDNNNNNATNDSEKESKEQSQPQDISSSSATPITTSETTPTQRFPSSSNSKLTEEEKEKEKIKERQEMDRVKNLIHYEKLLKIITECGELICRPNNVSVQEAKSIAAKVYYCQNPRNVIQRLKRKTAATTTASESTESSDEKKQKL